VGSAAGPTDDSEFTDSQMVRDRSDMLGGIGNSRSRLEIGAAVTRAVVGDQPDVQAIE
jgi:hypothetical protein